MREEVGRDRGVKGEDASLLSISERLHTNTCNEIYTE